MKPVNTNNIIGSDSGDFENIAIGPHMCVITDVQDYPNNESLRIIVDTEDNYYTGKGWSCPSFFVSYAERDNFGTDPEKLKERFAYFLEAITEATPGFDAKAAIAAGKEQMLIGKKALCVFREEEYFNRNEAEFKIGSPRPFKAIKAADAEKKFNAEPKTKMLSDNAKRKALEHAGFDGSTIEQMLNGGAQQSAVTPSTVVDDSDCPF